MTHIAGHDRDQMLLLPEVVDDYVTSDNPVRFIDAFVDGLDLAALGFARVTAEATGRPGYAPGDLLKLYIYGYLNRVRSSRRLEAETHRNLEVIWLLRHLRPDFKTIADFRRDNRAAFRSVFREFVLLCRQLDLFGRELLAVDGTRIKAVNNKNRNFTRASLRQYIADADKRLADYLRQLDDADAAEGGTGGGSRADNLADKIEAIRRKRDRLRGLLTELEQSGESQISLTDPDSRAMAGSYQGGRRLQRAARGRRQAQADRRAGGHQPGRRYGPVAADGRAGARHSRRRADRRRCRSRLLPGRGYRGLRQGGPDAACSQAAARPGGAQGFLPQRRVPLRSRTGMSSPAQPGKPWNRTITAGRATYRKSTTATRRLAAPVRCERDARQTYDGSRAWRTRRCWTGWRRASRPGRNFSIGAARSSSTRSARSNNG